MLYQLSYMGSTSAANAQRTNVERVMGIEPTSSAWKAEVLPLNYTRADGTYLPAPCRKARPSIPPQVVEGEGFEPSKA